MKNIPLISTVAIVTAFSAGFAVSQPQPYDVSPQTYDTPPARRLSCRRRGQN